MTAAELIDLLNAHPKTCERLKINIVRTSGHWLANASQIAMWDDSATHAADFFRRWLIGACVEWCDEHGIAVTSMLDNAPRFEPWGWINVITGQRDEGPYPSRLHALLAAIEAYEETT